MLNKYKIRKDYVEIEPRKRKKNLVGKIKIDKGDFDLVSKYSWCFSGDGKYIVARINNRLTYLHRFIMSPATGMDIDHINGSRLDNRRKNLRECTRSENLQNKVIKGVSFHKKTNQWRAYTTHNGKQIHFGMFETEKAARGVYLDRIYQYRKIVRLK